MTMDDRPSKPGTRRALVPQRQGRAVESAYGKQIPSQGGRPFAGANPGPVRSASRRSIRFGGRAAVSAAVFCFAVIGLFYARLLVAPLSLSFLVPTLQGQINSQLQGYSFHARDAILRLSSGWRLEFRLADVRLADENNQEIAKAPFAEIGISEASLLKASLTASRISLLGPKLLIFNTPGKGLTLTAPPATTTEASAPADAPAEDSWEPTGEAPYADLAAKERMRAVAGSSQGDRQQPLAERLNPAPVLARLFSALKLRGGASSALHQIGVKDALVYFAGEKGVSTWRIADFHIDLEEEGSESALRGELMLKHDDTAWHASFRAVNRPGSRRYSLTASLQDIVPRTIWESIPALDAMKLVDLPISGAARFDIGHDGALLGGEGDIKFGSGRIFAPTDPHAAEVDGGMLKVSYDQASKALSIKPFELHWDDSLLTLSGTVAHSTDAATGQPVLLAEIDGRGTALGAQEFGVAPIPLDTLKISASYQAATDTVTLKEATLAAAGAAVAVNGQASDVLSGGPIKLNGVASPMPISLVKVLWPSLISSGTRGWIGSRIPIGRITGGSLSLNSTVSALLALYKDGDLPDQALSVRAGLSGLQIYHIKSLPPILAKDASLRFTGRHFLFDLPGEARIDLPSGRSLAFTGGQFAIEDLRPEHPDAEVRFKGNGDVASVLELLDQPALGYVKSTGFKPGLVNGQVSAGFKIGIPLVREPKLEQMSLAGKVRVSELKSAPLPGGLSVNGGAVNFDISQSAISANGDVKVNNIPVAVAWQRIYDAPPDRQPALRLASILNEKARDELGLNMNHIVKGDLPIALAVSLQGDGPPKFFMEANLTNSDVFLTAIGWRKPPGQKASLTFDLVQRPDNFLVLDNFALTGDGLNVNGHLLLNDKRRIAAFSFPEFSTNALTQLTINGELTPQNVLKVVAKGPSYDGRQFFRTLLSGGKMENQPAPLKDEPGLDLNVEIETVFGYYDTTLKSVVVDAKRRGGKLTYLEAAGRLNGEAPVAVHVEQKPGHPRMLTSDAFDAGSVFRLTGVWGTARGGTLNLRVNLDGGGGAEKTGVIDVRRFEVVGDEVVGRVVSQAERERARVKPDARNGGQQALSGERTQFDRMVVPFATGPTEFQIHDAALNGPEFGVTGKGRIDFNREVLAFSGTYVPFYGVNNLLGGVPLLGDLLTGPGGKEGIFAMTFAIQGRTSNPEVIVNPASMFAPGLFRQIFEFDSRPQALQ